MQALLIIKLWSNCVIHRNVCRTLLISMVRHIHECVFCVGSSSKGAPHCTPTLCIQQTGLAHTGKKHTGLAYGGRAPVRSLFVIFETRNRPVNPYQRQSFRNVHHHLQVSLYKHVAVVSQSVEVQTRNISSLRPIFSLSTLAN